ncbi:hypothetical protein M407DRAFT_246548 [Tulasnella calospora MUT 4182]|uniref:Mediator of RNA polymerase II transcription subunit 6 n=1 Tax=Tulasnella calospora MUT 4182 TaxID=1051891 RepID=A0A0C3L9K5_9AGAM|nr:hypothetical protein M407DRAFT_246548 [Tulasnella calospora MUT 4182]
MLSAMDYFMGSIFSDPTSNNAVLRMQYMHTGMPLMDEEERLKGMTGIEFSIVSASPPHLFVIHKRERSSPIEARVLAAYYIMNNAIYCAPDIYTVLSTRLQTSVQQLRSSLDVIRKHRPDFTPRTGYAWEVVQSPQEKVRPATRAQSTVPGEEGEGPDPSVVEDTRKSSSKAGGASGVAGSIVPAKHQFSALQRAMATTFKYIEERTPHSLIPIIPDEEFAQPPLDGTDAVIPNNGSVVSTVPGAATATPGTGLERAQTSTVGGSSAGYTPSGAGAAAGSAAMRSVSMVTPGTPAGNAASPGAGSAGAPGQPGLPGQGKKKKKRQATGALKAALGGATSPSTGAASPQSPTSPV